MYNWNKDQTNDQDTTASSSYIDKMQSAMDKICEILSQETKEFVNKDFFGNVYQYIQKNERLIYTNITNHIFTLDEHQFGILQTNIDSVVNYMYSEQYRDDFPESRGKNAREYERTQRTILKMWDHANLARRQYLSFHKSDAGYEEIVSEKMKIAEAKIAKDMNAQLISLVAIFTALSFLLFGGISSLDNILDGAKDIPILKLLIIGNIWCLCIMNLIFTFMFFVAKLTKLNIKSTDNVNANAIEKYPYIWWCNWLMCSSGIIFAWIYYLKRRQLLSTFEQCFFGNASVFIIFITVIIVICIMISGMYIVKHGMKNNNQSI